MSYTTYPNRIMKFIKSKIYLRAHIKVKAWLGKFKNKEICVLSQEVIDKFNCVWYSDNISFGLILVHIDWSALDMRFL